MVVCKDIRFYSDLFPLLSFAGEEAIVATAPDAGPANVLSA